LVGRPIATASLYFLTDTDSLKCRDQTGLETRVVYTLTSECDNNNINIEHSASIVLWQRRNGMDLAGPDISSGACGLIGGYALNLTFLRSLYLLGVAWLL